MRVSGKEHLQQSINSNKTVMMMFLHAGTLKSASPAKPFSGPGGNPRSYRFTSLFICSLHSLVSVLQHINFSTVCLLIFQIVI